MKSRTLKELMRGYLEDDSGPLPNRLNEISMLAIPASEGCPVQVYEGRWETVSDPTRYKKEFKFNNRQMLIDFINEVLAYQENIQHHGKITIDYDNVIIEVYTHDVNTITELDQEYIHEVDNIYIDAEYSNSIIGSEEL